MPSFALVLLFGCTEPISIDVSGSDSALVVDATITDEDERAELFAGHFANMTKLAEEGKLVLAGPFGDAPPLRGLFIFDVDTIDEAKELVKGDPTVTSGVFELEFATYYGSAALKKVNDIHATIQEKKM